MVEKSTYDNDLLNILKEKISVGKVKPKGAFESYVSEIEMTFVMGFNRIDWQKNGYIFTARLNNQNELRQSMIDAFLKKIAEYEPSLLAEAIVVIGDGVTNLCFETSFKEFMAINKYFFDLPQHTYVWFRKSKRCINLTFEGELFFG